MPKLFDRVKVNITTTGTGDVTFGSASSNAFLTPTEAGCADGDTVRYVIVDGTDYEEGIGTIASSVATMARTTVTKSKIGGTAGTTKLNLSGTAVLSLTVSAADILVPVNNLSDLNDVDTALDNLGATTVGKAVFTAANVTDARSTLGLAPTTIQRLTSGSGTYTPTSADVRFIRVRLVGGGGGGCGANGASGQVDVGAGGGGAGYVEHVMAAGSYSYSVGAGGAAQTTGGNSTFNSSALIAYGGSGTGFNTGSGTTATRSSGAGNGGACAGGNIVNIPGQAGEWAFRYGGSDAIGSRGGASHMGPTSNAISLGAGSGGNSYGGGGGGGGGGGAVSINGAGNLAGGAGAAGIIIVEEYY